MTPLPRLLLNLFERIDCCGDDPIILRQEDVPTADKRLLRELIRQGLLTESTCQSVTCTACDGVAEIMRSGQQGARLTAVCGECASVFAITKRDTLEYRTGWQTAARWAATLLGIQDEPEEVCKNAYYLGSLTRDAGQQEIYLCRQLCGKSSKETYDEVSETIRDDAVVISLSKLPAKPASSRLDIHPVQRVLSITGNKAHLSLPAPPPKNLTKSRAAHTRWEKDPLQDQKDTLYENVRKKLTTEFAPPLLHHEIYSIITKKYRKWLSYKAHDGKPKVLTTRMALDVIKAVLTVAGQSHRISGKFHSR